ncbi:type IV toxin-antitoxin system AbiEi family antitoxin [Desulfurivibrio sp. C05AmB]|jgi:hypothetical protein|uniref:type IV toxin-antitoxin system AbiEi family antitoxin n=1 Tax=Desulfurivibrio sp. C05AmB TaxID=3374371 RepID=UPI00376EF0AD
MTPTAHRQPGRRLAAVLEELASPEHYLFTLADLRGALPEISAGAFKTLLSRAEKRGLLRRICRGLYLYPRVDYPRDLLLFHAAARLRADAFNYISLETALSDAGVISQVPLNWITLMSSGRRNIVRCGHFGTIEFVHTRQQPAALADELTYDPRCRLWRASVSLALRDMRATRRNLDLIDEELARESA